MIGALGFGFAVGALCGGLGVAALWDAALHHHPQAPAAGAPMPPATSGGPNNVVLLDEYRSASWEHLA